MQIAVLVFTFLLTLLPAQAQLSTKYSQSSPVQAQGIVDAVVDGLWAHNDTLWHDGDYPRIIAIDRIIVGADPHFVECYNTGAWLMWSDGLDADADAFYRMNIHANPQKSAAYYDYGSFLMNHQRQYVRARRVMEVAARTPDADVLDWRMLAHAREKAGDLPGSVTMWQRIRTRWPHGAPRDPTHGGVDENNLRRVQSLLRDSIQTLNTARP